ncbi:MAG TPA: type VI secretion system baseplate subunit TssG [Fibrobacteria bacterium]|nr:type VI secretion system baseplate subunit TssG [Fibrobacteria bacterium]
MTPPRPPMERLGDEARAFEFLQWIRLWMRTRLVSGDGTGQDILQLLDEGLDIHHSGSLAFAPQDIASAGKSPAGREELLVHFLGLQGASSPLPSYLVDPLQSVDERWAPLRTFYRLFENRIYRILALGLILRSPEIRAELGVSDALASHLDQWAGCATAESRPRRLGGLSQLVPHARSRTGLERFLSRMLGIERIEADDGPVGWVPNPAPAKMDGDSRLDGTRAAGSELPVAGDRVEIRIGPVRWEQYRAWARDPESIRAAVRGLVEDFLPRPVQWDVVAILDPCGLPPGVGRGLGDRDPDLQACLGAVAWLGDTDPEPAMLSLAPTAGAAGGRG